MLRHLRYEKENTGDRDELTSMRRCLACCTSSCSWPPNMLSPMGSMRLRQATLRLAVDSMRRNPRCRPFFPATRIEGSSPSVGEDGVATDPLSWLGMIRAMLSISFANTKFCSSFLNIWRTQIRNNFQRSHRTIVSFVLTSATPRVLDLLQSAWPRKWNWFNKEKNERVTWTKGWRRRPRTGTRSPSQGAGSSATQICADPRTWWAVDRRRRCRAPGFGSAATKVHLFLIVLAQHNHFWTSSFPSHDCCFLVS